MQNFELIAKKLRTRYPGIEIDRLKVKHPGADDDRLWFIKVPDKDPEVQIESATGTCPFLIESSNSADRLVGHSVDQAIQLVERLLGFSAGAA